MSAPAGWYTDPSDPARQRWWDGGVWTAHVSPVAPAVPASPQYGAPVSPQYGTTAPAYVGAPKVTVDTNTVWIWLAIAVSVVPVLTLFLYDWDAYIRAVVRAAEGSRGMGDLLQWQLRSLAISAVSWLVLAAYVVFSWLDWRELRRRGIPAPFHWAWSFLGLLVYIIGRAVVLRRRAVSGSWPPLWAIIGVTVVSLVVASIWVTHLMQAMFSGLAGVYSGY